MYVEELALYHLDSLTKTHEELKGIGYTANGYIDNYKLSDFDTLCIGRRSTVPHFLKPRYENIFLVEDSTYQSFWPLKGYRRNHAGKSSVSIQRHLKANNRYYVRISVHGGMGGTHILITMDTNGNLLGFCSATYIY